MARLTVCLALSAILMLATGICPGNGQLPSDTGCLQLPGGQFPSAFPQLFKFLSNLLPLRIISKGNISQSMTADAKGDVLLLPTNCLDARQLWFKHSPIVVGNKTQFALVNVNLGKYPRAIRLSDGDYPVKLAPYNPLCVPSSMLWTQDAEVFGNGFRKIRSVNNSELVLDDLGRIVPGGTVVGAYPAHHDLDNVLWKTQQDFWFSA